MSRLQDRVAIITGAGDGIGRGIARAFAREGARVLIAEVDPAAGTAVADELTSEFGTEARAVTTDVADEAAVRAMVSVAVDHWGTVDILVNNAWGGGSLGRLEYKTNAQMAHGFEVGFYGPLWAMQAALPTMPRSGPRQHRQPVLPQRRQRPHRHGGVQLRQGGPADTDPYRSPRVGALRDRRERHLSGCQDRRVTCRLRRQPRARSDGRRRQPDGPPG